MTGTLKAARGALNLDCDVVVIGSGAGGAVAACTLAEAGRDVVLLEEGPHVPDTGQMRPSESVRNTWRDGAVTLAVGVGGSPSINVTAGRVLGGSSTATGGVCFRIPDHVLDSWAGEGLSELTPKKMQPWFEQVERDVHVEEVPVEMRSKSTNLFGQGLAKLGEPLKPMRRNTRGCNGCGRCNFGCPHRAKLSVDLTYLPRALAAGARIYTSTMVERVDFEGTRATGVSGRVLDRDTHKPGASLDVRARQVVLAAGAMYNPMILGRSGIKKAQLGRHLSLHPSFRVMGRFDEPVRGWEGALQSAYGDQYEKSEGLLFNSVFVPNGVLAATLPGFGPAHAALRHQVANLGIFGGMIHDDAMGRVRRGFGREPIMTYEMSQRDRARIPVLLRRMGETWFAAGAKEIFLPVFGAPAQTPDSFKRFDLEKVPGRLLECSSQHPLGTCAMGADEKTSVVNERGQVWGTHGLNVVCGSIMPSSLGVNPQLAIMTMALRVSTLLAESMR
ncbi:MAG: GMC family oxidoreductase [Myxococcaceae bacterium]